jgi:threonine dehydratase
VTTESPAEHGGATAYAALIADAYVPEDGEGVGIVVCGGNTDVRTLDPQPVQHRAATRMARAMMAVYPTAFNHGSRIVPINRVQGRTWLVRA